MFIARARVVGLAVGVFCGATAIGGFAGPSRSAWGSVDQGAAAPPAAEPLQTKSSDKSVTINKHYPKVGDRETSKNVTTVKLAGTVKNGNDSVKVETDRTSTEEKIEECLEVANQDCVKVKVTYRVAKVKETTNGKTSEANEPHAGKTFIVKRNGNNPSIASEDGSRLTDDIVEEVRKDYDEAPFHKKLLDALPSSVQVGDSLDAFAKVLAEKELSSSAKDKPTTAKFTLKVKGFGDIGGKKTIIIEMRSSMAGDTSAGKMGADVSGTVEIFADGGVPAKSSLTGPIKIELPKRAGTLEGKIAQEVAASYNY